MEPWFASPARPTAAVPFAAAYSGALAWRTPRAGVPGHLLPTGGVDTHRDLHVVAALDERGGLLDTNTFPATAAGYHDLVVWLSCFGPIERVGVEGTGTYGAGLARHLLDHGIEVIEVDRLNRQRRRRADKSDTTDAVSAARAALSGEASTSAKTRDGNVEKLRVLRVARRSTRQDRVRALNQLRSLIGHRTTRAARPARALELDLGCSGRRQVPRRRPHHVDGRTQVQDGACAMRPQRNPLIDLTRVRH